MQDAHLIEKQISPYFVVFLVLASVLAAVLFVIYFVFSPSSEKDSQRVLGEDVTVSVAVESCFLEITIYPEKRIPAAGNWSTDVDAEIYSTSNVYIATVTGTTDNMGIATFDLCQDGHHLPSGNYKFWIKGASHLRKDYGTKVSFDTAVADIDFTPDGPLLAGETSIIFDNFINVLDISTQITNYGSASNVNDLNQDGVVNILDISNTITNLYTEGECSPEDQLAGACPY